MVGAMPATAMAMASQVPAPWNRMADGSIGARGFVESISNHTAVSANTHGPPHSPGRDILADQNVKPSLHGSICGAGGTTMPAEREY